MFILEKLKSINWEKHKGIVTDFIRVVLVLQLIILVLTALVWWLLGTHTSNRFSVVLFWVGGIAIVAGFSMVQGSLKGTHNWSYLYARSVSNEDFNDRMLKDQKYYLDTYLNNLVLVTVGLLSMLLSALIYKFL